MKRTVSDKDKHAANANGHALRVQVDTDDGAPEMHERGRSRSIKWDEGVRSYIACCYKRAT